MPVRALAPITLALLVGFFACLLFARPVIPAPNTVVTSARAATSAPGRTAPNPLHAPIHEYNHAATGCRSITGGAFVPEAASWSASYDGAYLFGDYVCNKIFALTSKVGAG